MGFAKYRIKMNLHFKIGSSETKKTRFKLFCVTNKPCVFAKRVFRFLFTFFLPPTAHMSQQRNLHYFCRLKSTNLLSKSVNSNSVFTSLRHEQRRTRSCGSPLTVKTISCLWKLEWLAKCSLKVWKSSGSGRHPRHVWTVFWRFSNILLKISRVPALFPLDKVQIRFTRQEELYKNSW